MSEPWGLIFAGIAGAGLGVIFFGGLWWTVRKGMASARPALWFLGSLLIRMGLVLAGLYFVGAGDWKRLLASLIGFILSRFIIIRITRSSTPSPSRSKEENNDAP